VATSPARMSASSSDMSAEVTTTVSGDSGGRPEPNRRQVDATLSVVWFGASRETRYSTQCLAGRFPRRQQITSYVAAGVTGEPHQEIRRRRRNSPAAVTLMQHGCYRAQGYLLSRPIVSDAMESFLSSRWLPMPFLADGEAWLRQYSSEPTRDIVRCTFS
jgi:hypothetical protein